MSDFAPEFNVREPQEYMKASQGWSDSTIGSLFSGLGDTLKMGIKAKDDYYKRTVKDEVRAIVDDVQNATIDELQIPAQTGTARMRADRNPEEIDRFVERARRYQAGLNAGNIKESSYWAMLDAGARQLRSRYPGYRDTIDETMKEFTGQTPANALIRELRQDAEAAQRGTNDGEKRRYELIKAAANEGALSGKESAEALANPSAWPMERVMSRYADINKKQADYKLRQAQLATIEKEGEFDTKEVAKSASQGWGIELQKHLREKGGIMGQSFAEINRLEQTIRARGGFNPTPQETQQALIAASQGIATLESAYQSFMNAPRDYLGGQSYASKIGQKGVEDIKAAQLTGITDMMRRAVADKDFGMAKQAALMAELYADTGKRDVLSDEMMRRLNGIRTVVGDSGMGILLSAPVGKDGKPLLSDLQEAMKRAIVVGMADPTKDTSLAKEITDNKKVVTPELIKQTIDAGIQQITNPNAAPEVRKSMVRSMYGPNNEMFLQLVNNRPESNGSPDAAHRVFRLMANPTVSRTLFQASKDTGDSSLWNTYKNWVMTQTYALNALDINAVGATQADAPSVNIRFNPQTMSFAVEDTATMPQIPGDESPAAAMLRLGSNLWESSRTNSIRETVNRVNMSLAPLRDIAEFEGEDKTKFALAVMTSIGARVESVRGREAWQQSILNKMLRGLYQDAGARFGEAAKTNIKSGPYERSAPTDTSKPIDITPPFPDVTQGPAARLMGWLNNQFRSALPSRQQMDRDRNRRNMGQD